MVEIRFFQITSFFHITISVFDRDPHWSACFSAAGSGPGSAFKCGFGSPILLKTTILDVLKGILVLKANKKICLAVGGIFFLNKKVEKLESFYFAVSVWDFFVY